MECVQLAGAFGPPAAHESGSKLPALHTLRDVRHYPGRKDTANPVITLDLGAGSVCASFGMNLHGYPGWDALKGQAQDQVEVFTSLNGKEYQSQGFLKLNLWRKDIPVNYMWTDAETMTSGTFRLVPDRPVTARYVQYRVTNKRIFDCAGLEVVDTIQSAPFDLRIALPDDAGPIRSQLPYGDGSANSGLPGTSPRDAERKREAE